MAPSEKVAALRALRVPGLPRFRLADAADASAKDVYFIRHGEAAHNVAPRPWGEELVDAADEEAALLVGVAEERELGAEERLPRGR